MCLVTSDRTQINQKGLMSRPFPLALEYEQMSNWPSFEQMTHLAKNHPEQLEALRKAQVDAIIDNAPREYQQRLRGLQFEIDCKRRLHKNPVGACMEISRMMYESLNRLNRALNGGHEVEEEAQSAEVVAFPAASAG
jgi:hypothetical protein